MVKKSDVKTTQDKKKAKVNKDVGEEHVQRAEALGQAYCDAVQPMVWHASTRENFVADVQAMRRPSRAALPRG